MKLSRLIELLEQALGKKAVIQRMPEQAGDVPLTCADITKSGKLLGYAPSVKIDVGIPKFVEWFKKQTEAPGGKLRPLAKPL